MPPHPPSNHPPPPPPPEAVEVEVVYALPERQLVVRVALVPGLTAGEAVELSGLKREFPAVGEGPLWLGIFGEPVGVERELRPGDRVEIYRALAADPREARRRRAAAQSGSGRPRRGR